MKKIAFFDAKKYDIEYFKEYVNKDIHIKFFEAKLNIDTVSLTKGFDAVCVFVNDDLNSKVIDKLEENGIKAILLRCAGFNNVDTQSCYGRIHIMRVPAYSPYAVAEHAMAMLLTSVRRIHKAYIRTRDYNFSLDNLVGFDLYGKTIGVVGTGKIGKCFINICKGFGLNVLAYDLYPSNIENVKYVSIEELYKNSDIISFHCPLTEETKHLINEDSLKILKKGVVIINTSRGGLISSNALLKGIKERIIGGACLDVYEEEGDLFFIDKSNHIMDDDTLARLISMPNVILTSHQAFLTKEALQNIALTTINNYKKFINEGICDNEVCYKCDKIDICKKERENKCF